MTFKIYSQKISSTPDKIQWETAGQTVGENPTGRNVSDCVLNTDLKVFSSLKGQTDRGSSRVLGM